MQESADTYLPGTQLEELYKTARNEVVLVAPFVKAAVLERLLRSITNEVVIRCVTRWRPDEIVAGVSDLEVWHIVKDRQNTSLWLKPNLHAKLYRADSNCLVGSANITAAALGWSPQPNLELLVPMSVDIPQLVAFERELFAGSVQVDESLFEQVSAAVKALSDCRVNIIPEFDPAIDTLSKTTENISQAHTDVWLPALRHPEKLYVAYSGNLESLSTTAKILALADLQVLSIPLGLPKAAFEAYVAALLLQKPIIRKVDEFVKSPQRFGAVRDLLASLPCADSPNFDATEAWQILMRWLRHFLTDRYGLAVPRHSEVFFRTEAQSDYSKPE